MMKVVEECENGHDVFMGEECAECGKAEADDRSSPVIVTDIKRAFGELVEDAVYLNGENRAAHPPEPAIEEPPDFGCVPEFRKFLREGEPGDTEAPPRMKASARIRQIAEGLELPGYADAYSVKRELQAVIEWLDEREG